MTQLFEEFPPTPAAAWEAQIARDLKGRDPKTLISKTPDGIDVKPFYTAEDLSEIETREIYKQNHWKIGCEVSDPGSAAYAVTRGATVLYVEAASPIDAPSGVEVIQGDRIARPDGETAVEELVSLLKHGGAGATTVEFAVGPDYFEQIAKLRAARLLWPSVSKVPLRIVARTSKRNLTIYDPYVNLLRSTTEAMSAIIGGCDVLVIRPFDAAYAHPGEFSRRLSINTQLLLREESYFEDMPDPATGCWYLEWLTERMQRMAQDGYENGAARHSAPKHAPLVGVNRFPDPNDHALDRLAIEPDPDRNAWPFEKLRLATERHARAAGRTPLVLLVQFGDPKMRRARAGFGANFFATGGFAVESVPPVNGATDAVAAIRQKKPDIVVLCSSDAEYALVAHDVCAAVSTPVVVAGNPADTEILQAAGVAGFIHARCDVVQTLEDWQKRLRIIP